MDISKLKRLFDRGTAQEHINDITGNIGGEQATMYLTENFAYVRAKESNKTELIES